MVACVDPVEPQSRAHSALDGFWPIGAAFHVAKRDAALGSKLGSPGGRAGDRGDPEDDDLHGALRELSPDRSVCVLGTGQTGPPPGTISATVSSARAVPELLLT